MKILLIYPYFLEKRLHVDEIAAVPMGLYYVGAMLKAHGHEVEILNWHAMQDDQESIEKVLCAAKPDLVGFSILHANRWGGIDIAHIVKTLYPDVPVVFGGIGATFLWRHLLTHFRQIDYVVIGEGEFTLLRLVQAFQKGDASSQIAKIPGLALHRGHRVVQTPPGEPIADLDALPSPAAYFSFQHLSLTRGCPGRCTFCGSPQFWGRRVRAHSADYFVEQLAMLVSRGITSFFISDDTFTLNTERVIQVCQKIIDRGLKITWQAIAKVNAVNADMLYWMRKAGCIQISYGVESGAKDIRRLFCKDISERHILEAFDRTVRHGIMARAYFIYGAPGETLATVDQTLDLIQRIKPLSAIFYILDIFPGTALYEDFKARTGADDDIWLQRIEDILYFESDPLQDRESVLAFGRRLRTTYSQWLPGFALQIELKDDPSLYAEQADFLSRLGMTFSHGDYARINTRTPCFQVAGRLHRRALVLHPDHRAFWGLALLHQHHGQWDQALEILLRGLRYFPRSPELNICLGVSYIQQGQYDRALECLRPHRSAPEAKPLIARCEQALADKVQPTL